MSKKVSVLMPVRNAVASPSDQFNLWCAIESILVQDYENWELLIAVDDGSVDGTEKVLERLAIADPRIKVLNLGKSAGLGIALNGAAAVATGDYLARMDADDMSVVYRLSTQVKILDENPDVGITGS